MIEFEILRGELISRIARFNANKQQEESHKDTRHPGGSLRERDFIVELLSTNHINKPWKKSMSEERVE